MPRIRFSLRNFFLFLFVACLIGSNLFTAREVNRFRQANLKLQAELGLLVVSDRNKLHAIAVETHERLTWRWRLYVPKGKTFQVGMKTEAIPTVGLPTGFALSGLPEGDFTFTAAVRRDYLDKWRLVFSTPSGSISTEIPEEHSKWIVDGPGASAEQVGRGGQEAKTPGEPMVLLRHRIMQALGDGSSSTVPEPCDGVMIWIVEENQVP